MSTENDDKKYEIQQELERIVQEKEIKSLKLEHNFTKCIFGLALTVQAGLPALKEWQEYVKYSSQHPETLDRALYILSPLLPSAIAVLGASLVLHSLGSVAFDFYQRGKDR